MPPQRDHLIENATFKNGAQAFDHECCGAFRRYIFLMLSAFTKQIVLSGGLQERVLPILGADKPGDGVAVGVVNRPILADLAVHAEASRKQIPKIKSLGGGYGFDRRPFNLSAKRIKKNDTSLESPLLMCAYLADSFVGIANDVNRATAVRMTIKL